MASVAEQLQTALEHHRAGRLAQAEPLYRQILQADPRQADAWRLLGVIAHTAGHHQQALGCLNRALELDASQPSYHFDRAEVHRSLGHLDQAEAGYEQVLRLHPGHAQAHNNLGTLLQGRNVLSEAERHYQEALRLRPGYAVAANNLGTVLLNRGDLTEARTYFEEALRTDPGYAEAHNNLGATWQREGELARARSCFEEALRLRPGYASALVNVGMVWRAEGRLPQAVECFQQALRFKPDFPDAHYNLGAVLTDVLHFTEAQQCLEQALRLRPDYVEARVQLGNLFKNLGRLDEALAAHRQALALQPTATYIHSNLLFTMNYHPGSDAHAILAEARRWDQQHAVALTSCIQPHHNGPDPDRRLRIGYVSPDLYDHADAFFLVPLLSHHDHKRVEVFCYAQVAHPDFLTARLQGHADVWRNTVGLSDEQLADLIRRDQIDILVDLEMHTAGCRLLMFARKPAPVEVAWLGYPGTTGLSAMDYRLTDPYLDPPGQGDDCYSEESIRLADTFWCYDPLTEPLPIPPLPALQNGHVTFGCLNAFYKINAGVLALWAQVLHAVPHSRLLLGAPPGPARDWVLAQFERAGVARQRVAFADFRPRPEYLQQYQQIDVGLDPLPYNGHTTSLDGFWMGVPTITLIGQTVVGRAGWSQLCNLGLPELAARTPEQYVALAAQLAGDLGRLQELRRTLRQRMEQSPLMDGARFARAMEEAYRQMWRAWCQEQRA